MPFVRAGFDVERDDRVGEQVVAATRRAVLRRSGAHIAEREVDQAQVRIDRRVDPRRGAAFLPAVAFPGVVAEFAGSGRAPEMPQQVAVARIQGESGAAIAVVGADEQLAVVVHDARPSRRCRSLRAAAPRRPRRCPCRARPRSCRPTTCRRGPGPRRRRAASGLPRVCVYFQRVAPVFPSTATTLPNADSM